MKLLRLISLALIAICAISASPAIFAQEHAVHGNSPEQGIPYVRIASAADGSSYFEDGMLPLALFQLPSGDEAGIQNLALDGRSMFMKFDVGIFEDFHPSPNSQWLVVVQGEVEVGTSDGQLRHFTPGMLVLMDDSSGKGHTTRTIGTVPHIAWMLRKPVGAEH